jgi:putative transposase
VIPERPDQRKLCRRWNIPGQGHELTFSCYRRQKLFISQRCCQWLAEGVQLAAERHEFDVWAYVIMPEHVHLLVWPRRAEYSIAAILKTLKQSVGRRAIGWLRRENATGLACLATGHDRPAYTFWQEGGGYDRNICTATALRQAVEYIHANPVRRGLVEHPGDWPWSSWRGWHLGEATTIALARESLLRTL